VPPSAVGKGTGLRAEPSSPPGNLAASSPVGVPAVGAGSRGVVFIGASSVTGQLGPPSRYRSHDAATAVNGEPCGAPCAPSHGWGRCMQHVIYC
jgi:hypothetical protein